MTKEIILNNFYDEKEDCQFLSFNRPQTLFVLNLCRLTGGTNIWGRGGGKSALIAWLFIYIKERMPRSCWVLQGQSYQQIVTRTLPGTRSFMIRNLGLVQDRDFFINSFPPKKFALPFEAPLKPDNCLFIVDHKNMSCVAFTFFSQDRSSSRGPNRDGVIADESLLLDIDKFNEEAMATNRGNDAYYKDISIHHGVFHFSSMPPGSSWLFKGGEYYNDYEVDNAKINKSLTELQLSFLEADSRKDKLELWENIDQLNRQLKYFPSKSGFLYTEYNAFDNIENVGLRYITDLYNSMPTNLFLSEVLNKHFTSISDAFYPLLDYAKHTYQGHYDYSYIDSFNFDFSEVDLDSRQDRDCDTAQPLVLGFDFGTAINWIIVSQYRKDINQITFLNDFYVKSPKIIEDVVRDFCNYYRNHKNKMVYLYPDAEGNVRRANVRDQKTYVEQMKVVFHRHGWKTIERNKKKYNTKHHHTYTLWNRCLSEKETSIFPTVRFNAVNCKALLTSMMLTPAIDSGTRELLRKNKGSEKGYKSNREEATDGGDAADQIMKGLFAGRTGLVGGGARIM